MANRRGSGKDGGKCGICDRGVGERDQGVQCELCEGWFHAGCAKIPNEVYKVLGQITNLHWFCEVCNSSVGLHKKVLVAVGKMQEKMDNMEERMSSHQKETESEIRKVSARQVNFELEMARLKETIDEEFVEVHNNCKLSKRRWRKLHQDLRH